MIDGVIGSEERVTLEGRLVGVLRSPVSSGLICVVEDGTTRETVMCATRGYRQSSLERLIGNWFELTGLDRRDPDSRVRRLEVIEILKPDIP
ncbi:MAG: hypothetical protein ACP5O0_04905 [Acidimicrobiales bacterium]